MINFLLGAPGSGKSYEAVVFQILPALKKGRKIITNLPLDIAEICAIDPDFRDLIEIRTQTKKQKPLIDLSKAESLYKRFGIAAREESFNVAAFANIEDYGDPWRHPVNGSGPLYVIDECHIPLPRTGTPVKVEEWFSLHRHESADVVLISQSYGKVNKSVCDLVQLVYRVRKNTALGSENSYTRKVQDGLRGEVVNTAQRTYKPEFFPLYKSHTRGGGAELAAQDIRPIWMHWSFIGAAILIPSALGYLIFGVGLNPIKKPKDHEPSAVAQVHTPSPVKKADFVVDPASVDMSKPPGFEPVRPPPPPVVQASQPFPDPLKEKGVHIAGFLTGQRPDGTKFDVWMIQLSTNGVPFATVSHSELTQYGYTWTANGPCTGVLRIGETVRPVTCDLPQITLAPKVI